MNSNNDAHSTERDMVNKSKLNYQAEKPLCFLLPARLRLLRKHHKLKQIDVAVVLDVERSTYCCYEIGKVKPSYVMIAQLADFYSIPIDFLIGAESKSAPETI